jgi:subtilisin family serine protease
VTQSLPAWAWQFAAGHLPAVSPLPLDEPITAEWAWGGATGAGIKVAVIDSGVDASHPLVGRVAGGVVVEPDDSAPGGARIVEKEHEDLFGHGTACAGIIRKAAPDCDLYSVRVLGARLSGRGTSFAAGLKWAIDAGMHVVNMSLSTGRMTYFAVFHRLADEAYFRNTVLVCAVNNVPAPSFPSQFSSVISVAARDGDDPFTIAYNPAPPVEFGAPGIDLQVAWLGGRMMRSSGNSFACPHVTGLVARMLSKHPGLTPFQVKTVLHAVAENAQTN